MSPRSYRSPRRAAAAAETRERVLNAASDLLAAPAGARGFSLDAAAKGAGVTRLTVYNQFGSRRALLEAVFDMRAERGGMSQIAEAMQEDDPLSGIRRVIRFFGKFWSENREFMAHLHATSIGDPEFEESLRARNERRRVLFTTLTSRLDKRQRVSAKNRTDVVDLLFVLTGFHVYAELLAGRRTSSSASRLVEGLAIELLQSAGMCAAPS